MAIAITTRQPKSPTPGRKGRGSGAWTTLLAYGFAAIVVGLWMASAFHNPYVFFGGILLIPVLVVCELGFVEWISYQTGIARVWGYIGGFGALLAYAGLCLFNV